MSFRLHRSFERARPYGPLALLALAGLLALVVFASPAKAAGPVPLTIEYPGFGYGEVLCQEGTSEATFCEEEYETGTKLTLVPVAEEGSKFLGFWNGEGSAAGCKEGATKCAFTIGKESFVEALFEPIVPKLAVKYPGAGEGEVFCAVESGPPEACESEYEWGLEITLVPEAAEGSEFLGFKEGRGSAEECVGLEPCSFVLEADTSIEAPFAPIMHALTIAKAGTGQGTVTCNGTICASSYAQGTEVTLKAIPASGSTFAGWAGESCAGAGAGPCMVPIEEADVAVTATFEATKEPPPPPPIAEGMARAGATAKVKSGKAQVKLNCSGGPCSGTLKLTAKVMKGGKRKSLAIGKGSFALADGSSGTLKVKLSAPAMRQLEKARSLKARAGGAGIAAGAVRLKLVAVG